MAAIHDAVGIWIDEYPATPEVVLRALEEKEGPLEALKDAVDDVIDAVEDLFD